METEFFMIGSTLLVSFGPELDHYQAGKIKGKIDRTVFGSRIKNIVLDFSNTEFMDSSGVGIVMGRYKLIRSVGGSVTIVQAKNQVDRVFELAGVYEYVKKADSVAGILDQLEKANCEKQQEWGKA